MPGRTKVRKLSALQEGEIRVRVLDILVNSEEALNTDQIKSRDITLAPLTNQKLSRVLGYLVEMGFARKGKSKAQGRMVYKAVSKMKEQGYETDEDIKSASRNYNGFEWDFEDAIHSIAEKGFKEEE